MLSSYHESIFLLLTDIVRMLRRDGQTKQTSAQTGAFVTSVHIIRISVIYNNITARKIVQYLNPRSEKKNKLKKVLWRLFCSITATYNSL